MSAIEGTKQPTPEIKAGGRPQNVGQHAGFAPSSGRANTVSGAAVGSSGGSGHVQESGVHEGE
jgi:hypothetical protein